MCLRLDEENLDACRLRITAGKGGKDRCVPFPALFRETLALEIYSQVVLSTAQDSYDKVIDRFSV